MENITCCQLCKENKKLLLENHHINSKTYNGGNSDWNLVNLCLVCHKLIHHGLVIIEGWFGSTKGRILLWRKYDSESISGLPDPKVWLFKNAKINELLKEKK